MDWMQQLSGVIDRYASATAANPPESAQDDFDQVARSAPRQELADGLTAAFRSEQTPPFANMLGQLFGNSAGAQRASILASLAAAVGPAIVSRILAKHGAPPDAQAAANNPQAAQQVPEQAVREIAEEAEKKDPSIVERISQAYADQPQIVKTLGKAALAVALAQMANKHLARR
jgi:hypothetical protein